MKNSNALLIYWKALNYEFIVSTGADTTDAYAMADETEYSPIDTERCVIRTEDLGQAVLIASGSVIINVIECGDMFTEEA